MSLTSSINPLGFTAVRLHYSCDPEKNPTTERGAKWLDYVRRMYPDPIQFQQEFEINWWIAQGTRVYPEFSEALHTKVLDGYRDQKIIFRAWDFGWHAPACLIAQVSSQDQLYVLKEIVGREKTTREFAQDVIKRCAQWFPDHLAGYQDFCDPAGQKVSANASEKSEIRDVEVLNKLGIAPSWEYGWSRKDGRSLVHQLLQLRTPRPGQEPEPSMYVNAAGCPILLQGFLGKYVYPPSKGGNAKDEPDENNHPHADVHAALRYLCTGLFSALGLRRAKPTAHASPQPPYMGYGTPVRGAQAARWHSQ